jgi:hypothetical protein
MLYGVLPLSIGLWSEGKRPPEARIGVSHSRRIVTPVKWTTS